MCLGKHEASGIGKAKREKKRPPVDDARTTTPNHPTELNISFSLIFIFHQLLSSLRWEKKICSLFYEATRREHVERFLLQKRERIETSCQDYAQTFPSETVFNIV